VELALNLFIDLPKENMAYRSFQFKKNTNKYKFNIIIVADVVFEQNDILSKFEKIQNQTFKNIYV
jgi:hypothetical protein